MKNAKLAVSLFFLAALAGCGKGNKEADIITIDVNATHPEKELVLQDFMDVEYIPLETTDEFITQGDVMDIGEKYIIVKNWNNSGDIFIFDRKSGKGIRKINRKGQGAEEYTFINGVVLDENADEMFVNCASTKKIYVYDLSGNFKRSFSHTEGSEYLHVYNYDKAHLIRYDMSLYYKEGEKRGDGTYHAIISKQDGSIAQSISVPFDVIKAPVVQQGDGVAVTSVRPIIPYQDKWLIVETSSDTVYNYIPEENRLCPFLVKTPSQDPEILLTMGALTDRYYFMQTIKKVFDFTTGKGFPLTDLVYDTQEKAVFSVSVLNEDYVKKQAADMTSHPVNSEIACFQTLAANRLVEAYEEDGLKGRLKEIAANLNEESNPVLMLVRNKKPGN